MFITFEGGEGAGKSTQIHLLAHHLRSIGFDVVTTREPGGTPFAEYIRGIILGGHAKHLGPLAEAKLFAIARREHVVRLIKPALERGAIVLCDRFIDSSRALQGTDGVSPQEIETLVLRAAGDCMPDLTLMLFADENVVNARRIARGVSDRFESLNDAFHQRVRAKFLDIAHSEPERVTLINANGTLESVAELIAEVVQSRIENVQDRPGSAL